MSRRHLITAFGDAARRDFPKAFLKPEPLDPSFRTRLIETESTPAMDKRCLNCNRTDEQFPLIALIVSASLVALLLRGRVASAADRVARF